MSVQDKVAIVTGGGSGIGRASAMALARNGAQVVVADGRSEAAEAVRQEDVLHEPRRRPADGRARFRHTDLMTTRMRFG